MSGNRDGGSVFEQACLRLSFFINSDGLGSISGKHERGSVLWWAGMEVEIFMGMNIVYFLIQVGLPVLQWAATGDQLLLTILCMHTYSWSQMLQLYGKAEIATIMYLQLVPIQSTRRCLRRCWVESLRCARPRLITHYALILCFVSCSLQKPHNSLQLIRIVS